MKHLWIAGALALAASGCATAPQQESGARHGSASLHNAAGAEVGRATLTGEAGGVRLRVTATGLGYSASLGC